MRVREKVGIFDSQSGKSQGILIHVLGMDPGWKSNNYRIKKFSLGNFPLLFLFPFLQK